MSRNRRDVRCGFLFGASEADAPDLDLQNSSFADRKTDSQSVGVSLNGTHLRLVKLHVNHSKDETGPAEWAMVSLGTLSNLFILNKYGGESGILLPPFPASADESYTSEIMPCVLASYKRIRSSATVSTVSLIR